MFDYKQEIETAKKENRFVDLQEANLLYTNLRQTNLLEAMVSESDIKALVMNMGIVVVET